MANFPVHLNVAAIGGGVGASLFYYIGAATKEQAVLYFGATILGGILPDVDSDESVPLKMMQYIFANLAAFFVLFNYMGQVKIVTLLLIWMATFGFVMGVFYLFKRFTVHRGMFHSLPAATIFWFGFTLVFHYLLNYRIVTSWYIGMFIFYGYLIHLLLDEIYSVNFVNAKINKSFGTAFKLFNRDYKSVIIFYMFAALLFYQIPHKKTFANHFSSAVSVSKLTHILKAK